MVRLRTVFKAGGNEKGPENRAFVIVLWFSTIGRSQQLPK